MRAPDRRTGRHRDRYNGRKRAKRRAAQNMQDSRIQGSAEQQQAERDGYLPRPCSRQMPFPAAQSRGNLGQILRRKWRHSRRRTQQSPCESFVAVARRPRAPTVADRSPLVGVSLPASRHGFFHVRLPESRFISAMNRARARCKCTQTVASLSPVRVAISSPDNSSSSKRISTFRYLPGSRSRMR